MEAVLLIFVLLILGSLLAIPRCPSCGSSKVVETKRGYICVKCEKEV